MYLIGFNKDPTANSWARGEKYNFQTDIGTPGEVLRGRKFTSGHGGGLMDQSEAERPGLARIERVIRGLTSSGLSFKILIN